MVCGTLARFTTTVTSGMTYCLGYFLAASPAPKHGRTWWEDRPLVLVAGHATRTAGLKQCAMAAACTTPHYCLLPLPLPPSLHAHSSSSCACLPRSTSSLLLSVLRSYLLCSPLYIPCPSNSFHAPLPCFACLPRLASVGRHWSTFSRFIPLRAPATCLLPTALPHAIATTRHARRLNAARGHWACAPVRVYYAADALPNGTF